MRLRSIASLSVLLVVACAGGAAGASVLVPTSDDESAGPSSLQPDGAGVHVSAPAGDPAGRAGWAVRVYRSRTGQTCPELGRHDGERFGYETADGRVVAAPLGPHGTCTDLTKDPLALGVNRYPETPERPARTAVFGVTSTQVARLELRTDVGTGELAIDTAGAFLSVLAGAPTAELELLVELRDGTHRTYDLRGRHPD